MTDFFNNFDSWEPLFKARKAKGLDKWDRLKNISEKLQGKDIKAISFTCSHPSHGGEPVKHLLGSIEGNLHFLLGYGNPKFHLAPYHWQIVDPNTTDEEAEETFNRMHHPSNPVLWGKSGLSAEDEGDTAEGKPHPMAAAAKKKQQSEAQRQAEAIKAVTPTGSYTVYPSEGIVVGEHNDHVYRWDLVKDTFFTAQNPDVVATMEASAVTKSLFGVTYKEGIPDLVKQRAREFRGENFDQSVWPLVKSRMPAPGAVLKLETNQAERVFGVVTPTSLEFYGRDCSPVELRVFDRVYKSFDLVPEGNVPPAALSAFMVKHFRINKDFLSEITSDAKPVEKSVICVEGEPSPGWEDVDDFSKLKKSIVYEGDTIRLVVSQ